MKNNNPTTNSRLTISIAGITAFASVTDETLRVLGISITMLAFIVSEVILKFKRR
jgi:hypothetical protein